MGSDNSWSAARARAVALLLLAVLATIFIVIWSLYFDDEPEPPVEAVPTWIVPNTDDGKVYLWSAGQTYAAMRSLSDALYMANHVYLLTGQASKWKPWADDMVATNGLLELATYNKSIQYQGTPTFHPDGWYAHRTNGTKIIVFGNNVFLMNPASPFVTWNADKIKSDLARDNGLYSTLPITSVYLDSMGEFSYQGPPAGYTLSEWLTTMWNNVVPAIRTSLPDRSIIANGLKTNTKPHWNLVDGLLDENWVKMKPTGTSKPTDIQWQNEVNNAIAAQDTVSTFTDRKVVALGLVYLRSALTEAQDDYYRDLVLASYYIANHGRLMIDVKYREQPPWVSKEFDRPQWQSDLGAPTEFGATANDYKVASGTKCGLYERSYTKGEAFVNTCTVPMTVNATTVAAQSGKVVTAP